MVNQKLQFTLLQARNPSDPVREEEREAFAERLGIDVGDIHSVDILTEDLHFDLLQNRDALLIGGAGEYSVCKPVPGVSRMIDFLGEVAERGFPTFASCFGFQSLVTALGGEVINDEEGAEVGSFYVELLEAGQDDPLFGGLPARFVAQQGHKDRASRLPSQAICLAKSERAPFQAIRIGDKPVYATQFHPELTSVTNRQRFERYLDHYGHVFGPNKAKEMLDEFMPSPEASGLLRCFADALRRGRL
jgi:GMP synthase (glutamine-hydrolysing)